MKDEAINNIIKKGETIRELTEKINRLNDEIHGQAAIETFVKYVGKNVRVKFLNMWDNTLHTLEGVLDSANGYTIEFKAKRPAVVAGVKPTVVDTVGIYIELIVDFEIVD